MTSAPAASPAYPDRNERLRRVPFVLPSAALVAGVTVSARAEAVAQALLDLPLGSFRGQSLGRDWLCVRSLFAGGASEKLVARALDGSDYISLNLYRLESGPRLKPCEMSAAKVADFVADLQVV